VKEYELIFVVKPDLTDQDIGSVTTEVKGHVEKLGGSVVSEDLWGKKQLSFEIKDCTEGVYTYLVVELGPEGPGKLKDQLKIDERIIRYMITVKVSRRAVKLSKTPEKMKSSAEKLQSSAEKMKSGT